jgi:hypothetical protein
MTRPVYCLQNGIINQMSESEFKKQYKNRCLQEAENLCDMAVAELKMAKLMLEESHKYD